MTAENLIKELVRYRDELTKIKNRFNRTNSGIHINNEDDPRLRTFVIELMDLINDSISENKYSLLIQRTFNAGISNFLQSPSYKSVEDIISILDSIITRIKRNPELCNPKKINTPSMKKTLAYPGEDSLTLKWLWQNVPYKFWIWLISLLIASFLLGVFIGQSKLYQDLTTKNANSPTLTSDTTQNAIPMEQNREKTVASIQKDTLKK